MAPAATTAAAHGQRHYAICDDHIIHGHSSSSSSNLNNSSLSSNSSATTVMADGSGGASTAVLVYLHLVTTGVTVVDNSGTSVVTALAMALVVATAAVI